ncbi:hypothetical protein Hanom_Chr08g00711011 [Helianthus anomalus]
MYFRLSLLTETNPCFGLSPSSSYTLRRNQIILTSMSNSMVASLTGFSAGLSAVTGMLFMFSIMFKQN